MNSSAKNDGDSSQDVLIELLLSELPEWAYIIRRSIENTQHAIAHFEHSRSLEDKRFFIEEILGFIVCAQRSIGVVDESLPPPRYKENAQERYSKEIVSGVTYSMYIPECGDY